MIKRFRWLPFLVVALFLAAVLVFARHSQAATDFTYDIALNYKLQDSGTTTVTANYKVTYNRPDRILDLIRIAAPTNDVQNLKATSASGGAIATSLEQKSSEGLGYNYDYKEITVDFTAPDARGSVLEFTVSYDTNELTDVKGSSRTLYVPSLSQIGADEKYTVSVSVPQDFGKLFSTGILPELNGADGNLVRYTFPKAADLKRSVSLIFGESTIYEANFAFPLDNTSGQTKRFTIALPPDTSSQKIFIKKLTPEPIATRLDPDGNILADYDVPARTKIVVNTDVAAQVKYLEYDLSTSGSMQDIPAEIAKKYTKQTQYWQSTSPELQVKAAQTVAGTDKVIDKVRNLYKLTVDTLSYNNEKIQYNIRQGSDKALANPDNAVCLEYSDLLIALLRSQNIPARMPVGYAYAGNLKQSKAVADSLHSWVEVYVPGIGWMNLDPTWGEKFDNFGKSDLDHFAFAVWGSDDATPTAVMVGDQDMNYQYENTTISYGQDFPNANREGKADVSSYVVFPGFSISRYSVTAPENVAGDNYAAQIKHGEKVEDVSLGSLAPRQEFSQNVAILGSSYGKTAELLFVQKTDGSDTVLAVATGSAEWWPFIVLCVFLSGIIGLILVELRLSKQRSAQGSEELSKSTKKSPEKQSQDYMPAAQEAQKEEQHGKSEAK
ncbi:MAG: Transglutaminase family protein [Patescibacteria group bacterium]|nr:Transglutaminase family protein [Patescibacteria group bacterium]